MNVIFLFKQHENAFTAFIDELLANMNCRYEWMWAQDVCLLAMWRCVNR